MYSNSQSVQLGIYIHIPFCSQKCFYCDFNSGPIHQATRKTYLRSLNQEITLSPWKNATIETLFLMSDVDKQIISSKFVKEIAKLNGRINNFVTKSTIQAIKKKI